MTFMNQFEPDKNLLEILSFAESLHNSGTTLLKQFNDKGIHLKDLTPHKRILLFFITRSIKTFEAVTVLARKGFGQDLSILLRSLIEHRISMRYILNDPNQADLRATRCVDYKWILFKKYISQHEQNPKTSIEDSFMSSLIKQRSTILNKVDQFKQNYRVKSDRALITWSGQSLRDMAKSVNNELLGLYDTTFRKASKFSHPSIIGDQHHIGFEDNLMIFKPTPNSIGIDLHCLFAQQSLIDIFEVFAECYELTLPDDVHQSKASIAHYIETHTDPQPKTSRQPSIDNPKIQFEI